MYSQSWSPGWSTIIFFEGSSSRVPSFLTAIDAPLMARGYTSEGESCVLYGEIDGVAAVADPGVELSPHAGTEWLAAMGALQGHSAAHRQTYRRMVRAIAVPAAFAALRIDGRLVALAYGAVSDGLLCYESVITDPRRRRQGLARRVIGSLAAWAREEGTRGVCLQVEAGNTAALDLPVTPKALGTTCACTYNSG